MLTSSEILFENFILLASIAGNWAFEVMLVMMHVKNTRENRQSDFFMRLALYQM
jgi:hypothetical protein